MVVLLLAGLVLGACRPQAPARNVAVIGSAFDMQTVNELLDAGSDLNNAIVDQLFVQLVDEQPDYADGPAQFSGRLAESWQFNDDRSELTFVLRAGLVWSDGHPISAEDVRFTWLAQTSPDVAWAIAWIKETIDDVEVVDDRTVRFHFSTASATQIADATEGVILPSHVWGQIPFAEWRDRPQWFNQNLVVSGPFDLGDWQPGEQITLVRNPRYYEEGLPALDEVIFRIVPDTTSLVSELLAGNVDMIRMPEPSQITRIEESDSARVLSYVNRVYSFVSWNTSRPLFENRAVRQALALAIDRQAIVDTLWFGRARVATSPVLSWIWPHDASIESWPYDPDLAKQRLDEEGFIDRNGDGVREKGDLEMRFELTTNAGNELRWNAAQMIQSQLAEVGIDVIPRQLDYGTLARQNESGDYDATIVGLAYDTNHDFSYLFHSAAANGGLNYGRYSNPELDRLIEEVNAAVDKRDVEAQLLRIQRLFHEEQPVLLLWEVPGLIAVSNRLDNVVPDALSEFTNLRSWRRVETSSKAGSPAP